MIKRPWLRELKNNGQKFVLIWLNVQTITTAYRSVIRNTWHGIQGCEQRIWIGIDSPCGCQFHSKIINTWMNRDGKFKTFKKGFKYNLYFRYIRVQYKSRIYIYKMIKTWNIYCNPSNIPIFYEIWKLLNISYLDNNSMTHKLFKHTVEQSV